MKLNELHQIQSKNSKSTPACKARIKSFCGDPLVVERLKEMGLHQGLEVQSVGQAPFGGPLLFRFGNTVLALRAEEAECTLIETL